MATSVSVRQRAVAAIVGGVVADAAVQPLHWIYSLPKLESIIKDCPSPEFWKESHCPYYTVETGNVSNYADQACVLLKTLVEKRGFVLDAYIDANVKAFGPGTDYDKPRLSYPIKGPWRQMSITQFLENVKAGKRHTGAVQYAEIDGPAKIVPLVALYAGRPELEELVETAVRTTQNNDVVVKDTYASAKILESIILNGASGYVVEQVANALPTKYAEAKREMLTAVRLKHVPHKEACRGLGCACELPGSFMSCVHGVATETDYVTAVRATLRAGGSNCGRACFIGACLAAQGGLASIPQSWIDQTFIASKVRELAEKLMDIREELCLIAK